MFKLYRITILLLFLLSNFLYSCQAANRKQLLYSKKPLINKTYGEGEEDEEDDYSQKKDYEDSDYQEEEDDENDESERESIVYEYISSDDAYSEMLDFIKDVQKGICLKKDLKTEESLLRPQFHEDAKIVKTILDEKKVKGIKPRITVTLHYKNFKNDKFQLVDSTAIKHRFLYLRSAQEYIFGVFTFHFYPTNSRDAIDDKEYLTVTLNFHAGYGALYRDDCSDRLRNLYATQKKKDGSNFKIPITMSYKIPHKNVQKIQLSRAKQIALIYAFIGGQYIAPKTS